MKKLTLLMALIALTSCGNRGKMGKTGMPGQDGQDAEIITVKFCPNLIDSYGTQYSEYGVCINNKVYAVYSTNNQSFLTELSAGRYTTTTPFGNCQFTVVEGSCEVE